MEQNGKPLIGEPFENFEFKKLYDIGIVSESSRLERRKAEYLKIREKYPQRIPVVVAKLNDKRSQDLPDLDQNKYNMRANDIDSLYRKTSISSSCKVWLGNVFSLSLPRWCIFF